MGPDHQSGSGRGGTGVRTGEDFGVRGGEGGGGGDVALIGAGRGEKRDYGERGKPIEHRRERPEPRRSAKTEGCTLSDWPAADGGRRGGCGGVFRLGGSRIRDRAGGECERRLDALSLHGNWIRRKRSEWRRRPR